MELLDVYDNNGNKTGKIIDRETPDSYLSENEHIPVSIIYIENNKNEFLIQKLTKYKGGMYSTPGGHVIHGEEPIDAIKRETKEELELDISQDNIIDLGYLVYDYPIRFIFYLKKDIDLNSLKLLKEEVESISYMSVDKIKELINNGLMHEAHIKVLEKVLEYKSEMI